jgi:hypothetical protein
MGRRARMRKLREEDLEELAEQLEAEPEKAAVSQGGKQATPVDKAIELQKTAGNRAVGAALQRWPVFGGPLIAQWPKEPQMIVDGQVIPIESFQEGIQASTGTGTGTSGNQNKTGATGPGEIIVTLKMGKHSADLLLQATRGPGYKTVEIVIPTKDGNNPLESLALNFKKREFSQDPPPPAGRR